MSGNPAQPFALASVAHGSISTSYTAVNSTPYNQAVRMLRMVNPTDGDLIFSLDGATDHFFVPAGTFVLYDVAANRDPQTTLVFPAGMTVYVKYSTAPSKLAAYVEAIWGPNTR